MASDGHRKKVKDMQGTSRMQSFFPTTSSLSSSSMNPLEAKVRRAEVKVTAAIAKHNIPLAFADHLSPLFKEIFPDSEIAKAYSSCKTKITCILNGALKPYYQNELVEMMKDQPYSVSIDGSNDTGQEKMNPVTVKLFDTDRIKHKFLDMCTTTGTGAATAEVIFNKMDSVLSKYAIPWTNCVSLSVDNTSVNLGVRNSLSSRLRTKHPEVYVIGCPCHIIHNTCSKAATSFSKETGFDVEDLAVDVSYWFDKSTKRKASLAEFCLLCDTTYKDILKHVSTRWLSLEQTITRILALYNSLVSYFKSNDESKPRFKRLQKAFSNPMTEIYLLFLQSVIPLFTKLNLLLQRQEPVIYLLDSSMKAFLKSLFSRFVDPQEIVAVGPDIIKTDFSRPNQLPDHKLYLGMFTRSKMMKLLDEGDIAPSAITKLMKGARAFFESASSYALSHLPFNDELLQSSAFVNMTNRLEADFSHVSYFVQRFNRLLPFSSIQSQEQLYSEFCDYQTIQDTIIPLHVWNSAKVLEKDEVEYHRMDILWGYLGTLKDSVTSQPRFFMLSKVAKLVLTIPHSNADEERVFSLIRQNKTDSRNSLSLDGTLSSILTVKMACEEPCYKYEPTVDVVKKSKTVTWEYNKEHRTEKS